RLNLRSNGRSPNGYRERAAWQEAVAGERYTQGVQVQEREAVVIRAVAPGLHAAEAGADTRCKCDYEGERRDEDPAVAQVAERPAQEEERPPHRPYQCSSETSAR